MTMPADTFAAQAAAAIVEDRRVPVPTAVTVPYETYAAVHGEFQALVWQVAEMARNEPHQLTVAAEYLHGLLDRQPLRSAPSWEPQRVVLGLFLLGLTNALRRLEVLTAEERRELQPAYHREAIAAVNAAFDPTFIPPETEEEPMDPAPAEPYDDADAVLF